MKIFSWSFNIKISKINRTNTHRSRRLYYTWKALCFHNKTRKKVAENVGGVSGWSGAVDLPSLPASAGHMAVLCPGPPEQLGPCLAELAQSLRAEHLILRAHLSDSVGHDIPTLSMRLWASLEVPPSSVSGGFTPTKILSWSLCSGDEGFSCVFRLP